MKFHFHRVCNSMKISKKFIILSFMKLILKKAGFPAFLITINYLVLFSISSLTLFANSSKDNVTFSSL